MLLTSMLPKSVLRRNSKKNPETIDETFFSFLKANDKFFSEMKIINLDEKEETLKVHLDEYFKTMHSKYNQDKLFYFYFQLVLMELFLTQHKIELPRKDLKDKLEVILKNKCFKKKKALLR